MIAISHRLEGEPIDNKLFHCERRNCCRRYRVLVSRRSHPCAVVGERSRATEGVSSNAP